MIAAKIAWHTDSPMPTPSRARACSCQPEDSSEDTSPGFRRSNPSSTQQSCGPWVSATPLRVPGAPSSRPPSTCPSTCYRASSPRQPWSAASPRSVLAPHGSARGDSGRGGMRRPRHGRLPRGGRASVARDRRQRRHLRGGRSAGEHSLHRTTKDPSTSCRRQWATITFSRPSSRLEGASPGSGSRVALPPAGRKAASPQDLDALAEEAAPGSVGSVQCSSRIWPDRGCPVVPGSPCLAGSGSGRTTMGDIWLARCSRRSPSRLPRRSTIWRGRPGHEHVGIRRWRAERRRRARSRPT